MTTQINNIITDGVEMEYFRFGNGERTIAIIPGLSIKSVMASADVIVRTFSLFSKEFTVYVFDRRKNLPDEYSIEDMADDQCKVFDALGLKNVALYAISQGGMIALQMSLVRPDLVSAMVLGSTCSRINELGKDTIVEWNCLAKNGNEALLIDSFGRKVFTASFYEKFADIIRGAFKGISEEEFKRLAILTDKIEMFDVYDRLGEIKCPVFVMGGDQDMIFGVEAFKEIAEELNCEIYVFEGFGHAVYDETPEFKEKALEFFKRSLI